MPRSNFDFTVKFFRPPQRTVSCHNGLLDTRTKHTVAKDRLVVAEQRILDVERRKSASNLQLLAFEQKQLEKKVSSFHSLDQSLHIRHRSISEANLRQTNSWNEALEISHTKLYASLYCSNQNLLSLPKSDDFQRSSSTCSSGDISENPFLISDQESGEDDNSKSMKKKSIQVPIVTVIPPEEESLFLVQ